MQISLIFKIKIDFFWTAVIIEFRFIRLSAETETVEVTEIVKATVMILTPEEWLLEVVTVLSLTGTALTAAMIQDW